MQNSNSRVMEVLLGCNDSSKEDKPNKALATIVYGPIIIPIFFFFILIIIPIMLALKCYKL
ncbi:hypothetical protein I3760_04G020200 [Carya illinoinensis]|nr:hypothetical protein I3760_04G020200 [Carya illinoinensis]